MTFQITIPTRHTDTFAATGFVHAGVLLALTELAYAAFEKERGLSKPDHVYSVQRETRAVYHSPLRWKDGATIEVETVEVRERGFTQEFTLRSAESGALIAVIAHQWAWMDTKSGHALNLSDDDRAKLGA